MTAVSPFDLFDSFRDSHRHLIEAHGRRPMWYPDTETFEAYCARLEELHTEIHTEFAEGDAPLDHGHGFTMPDRCVICDGRGIVIAFGISTDKPITAVCPECAGLAITPA